jgi:hypothetical protein
VQVGGSLSNYKVVLHYSLTYPGRSNLETVRLVEQELVATSPKDDKKPKGTNNIQTELFNKSSDYIIKIMKEELANVKPFSKPEMGYTSEQTSLEKVHMTHFDIGQYIDIYI